MSTSSPPLSEVPTIPQRRRVFSNRTLNLRSIGAIGYDMDYTLIQYNVVEWERLAYTYARKRLIDRGWPVAHLTFDPELMIQGLVIDTELGNLLKVNCYGHVKHACHGPAALNFDVQRQTYARTIVDHRDPRCIFLSTLFSVSEACLFAQLVELFDCGELPEVTGYADLYGRVRETIDRAHRDGWLKSEIAAHPEKYVELDAETSEALLDQRGAGKKLLLITNSEWSYTRRLMSHAFDRFLPSGMGWRDLFDVIVVSANKPDFFNSRSPLLTVINDDGLLQPLSGEITTGSVYFGGNAPLLEQHLQLSPDQILFVGDHFFGDVHATKSTRRWRTALVIRELENDLTAATRFEPQRAELVQLMAQKEQQEQALCWARLLLLRSRKHRPRLSSTEVATLRERVEALRSALKMTDQEIAPRAHQSAQLGNPNWGPIMRAGNDKSYLAHLVERHADIYTSRVSNFLFETPFAYFRSARGSLPHDLDR